MRSATFAINHNATALKEVGSCGSEGANFGDIDPTLTFDTHFRSAAVPRAIDNEIKKSGADCVFLDMTHLDGDYVRERFPTIAARCNPPTSCATWSLVAPIARAAIAKRWNASTLSVTATPVASAFRYSVS